VDFPLPLAPTRATVFPASTFRLKSLRTTASGRQGYVKLTCWNTIWPWILSNTRPFVSSLSISGTLSILLNIRVAATEASVKYFRSGSAIPRDLQTIQLLNN